MHEDASTRPWTAALKVEPDREQVRVGGLSVIVSVWELDPTADRDVLLVHGGAAHREWWDHLAPLLDGVRRVVAPDLTGHGASDRRGAYTVEEWADEIADVAAQLCQGRPTLIGHSLGGWVVHTASGRHPEAFAAVLALDSPLKREGANLDRRAKLASRPVRSYEDREVARDSWRTHPPVTRMPREVVEHITLSAFAEIEGRWALRYDPVLYLRPQPDDDSVFAAPVPTWWVHAGDGLVDERMAGVLRERLGARGTVVRAPGVTHHMILEDPLAALWAINTFLAVTRER